MNDLLINNRLKFFIIRIFKKNKMKKFLQDEKRYEHTFYTMNYIKNLYLLLNHHTDNYQEQIV